MSRSIDSLTTIVVSEPALARRQFALDHGATIVIDPSESEPATVVEAIMKATNGIGVDIAFDAAGSHEGLDAALPSIRSRGMYLIPLIASLEILVTKPSMMTVRPPNSRADTVLSRQLYSVSTYRDTDSNGMCNNC